MNAVDVAWVPALTVTPTRDCAKPTAGIAATMTAMAAKTATRGRTRGGR